MKPTALLHAILSLATLIALLSACGTRRSTTSQNNSTIQSEEAIAFAEARPIAAPWQIKADLSLGAEGSSISLSADVALVVGQGIYASLRPFVLYEVARVYLLPQEVVIIDKHNKTYLRASYQQLNATLHPQFPLTLSYPLLEGLLLGYLPQGLEVDKMTAPHQAQVQLPEVKLSLLYTIGSNMRPSVLESSSVNGTIVRANYSHYTTHEKGILPDRCSYRVLQSGASKFTLEIEGNSYTRSERAYERISIAIPSGYRQLSIKEALQLLTPLFQ